MATHPILTYRETVRDSAAPLAGPVGANPSASSYTSVMVQMMAGCPRCGASLALGGLTQAAHCPQCGEELPLPPTFWQRALARTVAEALQMPEGKGRSTVLDTEPPAWLLCGRKSARCPDCRRPYPIEALEDSVQKRPQPMFCPECGAGASVRAVPEWFAHVHPAATLLVAEQPAGGKLEPFYLLIDRQHTLGSMPMHVRLLCDFGIEPWGRMVLAWHAREGRARGHDCRIGLVDRRGMLVWVNDEVEFSASTTLHASAPDGVIVLVDGVLGRICYLDVHDGALMDELPRPGQLGENGVIDPRGHQGVAIDNDGTILLRHDWGYGPCLRRYGRDGTRRALWWRVPLDEEDAHVRQSRPMGWNALPARLYRLPEHAIFTIGWDGDLYIADRNSGRVLRFDPQGRPRGRALVPPAGLVRRVKSIAADRQGRVAMLFSHAAPIGATHYDHIAYFDSEEQFHVWMGVHAPGSTRMLGTGVEQLKVFPDGRLFTGGGLSQLRMFRPTGTVIWESPLAALEDRALREMLARIGTRHA